MKNQTAAKKPNQQQQAQPPQGTTGLAVRAAQDMEVLDEQESLPAAMPAGDSLARDEIDMQIATARRYPRDPHRAIKSALKLATYNEEIAEGCFYVLRRGGKVIEGPSIRLAEIIASCWGNIRYGARVVEEGQRFVTSLGFCHDLETNVAFAGHLQRRITNRDGQRYDDDMIGVTGNAANSIAMRNAINRVVPRVYTDMILREVKRVAVGDASTFASKRDRVIERFGKMGVTPEQVCAGVGRESIEAISLEDLELLIGAGTAIKEGVTTLDAVFPVATEGDAAPTRGAAGLKNILAHARSKPTEQPQVQPAAAETKPAGEPPPGETERIDPAAPKAEAKPAEAPKK